MNSVPRNQQYGQIRRGRMAADIIGQHFTQISNAALRDPRLSFKARGILAWLASHQDGYGCSVAAIVSDSDSDGKAAVRSALDELEAAGYLTRERVRDPETGRLGPSDYIVTDCPMSENLTVALTSGNDASSQVTPNVRFPGDGKSDTKNTRPKNTSKNIPVDSSSSAPRSTREPVDDDGATGEAKPGVLSEAERHEIACAVIGVRPEWHTPGIMAQLRLVERLPADTVRAAFVAAANDRSVYTPMHLATAAFDQVVRESQREAAGERKERQAEEWRRQVHDDAENRSKPETRAQMIQRLKDEKAHALAAKRHAAQGKPAGASRGAGTGESV